MVAAAASNSGTMVELLPPFPEEQRADEALRPAPCLEARFRHYAKELGGRTLRVQMRKGSVLFGAARSGETPRGPLRVLIGLKGGEVVAIERAPIALQLVVSRYFVIAFGIAAVLLLLLLTLLWQVVWPIARLAQATNAFRDDIHAADARISGAHEVKALAEAFNTMKRRIGGLVTERTHMLAAIAHDLRTYLTRLRLRADHIVDARQHDRAVGDIEEMGKLLDDILLFARVEAGARREQESAVIDARAETLEYAAKRRETGDEVAVAAGDQPLLCRCAPLAFRRILANLIDNAIRYGTRARVVLRADGDTVVMRVLDDGPGIDSDLVERLTAPFERLEPSRGRHSGGAGLGLSIVKALAESHGGCLILENRSPHGLRATVRLPDGVRTFIQRAK